MRWLLFFCGLLACSPATDAAELKSSVVALLSSEAGPHKEALGGLEDALGEPVTAIVLAQEAPVLPPSTRVVVAFGSKAAALRLDKGIALIYVLAPGLAAPQAGAIEVEMLPHSSALLKNLKILYPGLKRLGVFWQSAQFGDYVKQLKASAAPLDIAIEPSLLTANSDLPDHLRALYGKVDALWLPPDPVLLNAKTLPVFLEFSRDNRVALFVPFGGLVDEGATASVGPSFRDMGKLAGKSVRELLEGAPQTKPHAKVYCTDVDIVIGKTAAERAGLRIPERTSTMAVKVVP